ncbi:hypothetical protein ABE493_15680 [Stenotrophomonas terrae]|uniref:hypothetical protein n=1 Tax=Stenotrophomonas terrae TaxID=405446 RepID=UPI003207CE62
MSNNIDDIIRRNNQLLINQAGFRTCKLKATATQHVLSYEFSSGADAETFKQQRELLAASNGMRYVIENSEPHVVLEYRITT